MWYIPMRYTPMMHACEMHAHETHTYEVHAHEVHAYETHTYEIHAHEIYACEMHVYKIHTHEIHAYKVHAYETITTRANRKPGLRLDEGNPAERSSPNAEDPEMGGSMDADTPPSSRPLVQRAPRRMTTKLMRKRMGARMAMAAPMKMSAQPRRERGASRLQVQLCRQCAGQVHHEVLHQEGH
jgi:hypothetical protein